MNSCACARYALARSIRHIIIKKYDEILAWKKAINIARLVYAETKKQPLVRDFGLCNQMRRAAVSIGSNIAEGFERGSVKEFIRFIYIAKGSAGELRTQIIIAKLDNSVSQKSADDVLNEIEHTLCLIGSFIVYLKKRVNS